MYALQLSATDLKKATTRIFPITGTKLTEIHSKEDISLSSISQPTSIELQVEPHSEIIELVEATTNVAADATIQTESANPLPETATTTPLETPSKILYRISLFQSENRIPFNDPKFRKIKMDISELKKGEQYEYTVMAVPQARDLTMLLAEIRNSDFPKARVDSFDLHLLNESLIRVGRYIEPKNAERLNIEFSKLADIKFEYNSAVIRQESFKNLNYIAAMLMLEEDFTLKISAHTCSVGGTNFNQHLSEERAKIRSCLFY
ncbi:MAG: hypothetical protein IPP69_18230 [Flavobacteriales bacterium]|nr:hypothetical protein [Flavobacteriales bacterium]